MAMLTGKPQKTSHQQVEVQRVSGLGMERMKEVR